MSNNTTLEISSKYMIALAQECINLIEDKRKSNKEQLKLSLIESQKLYDKSSWWNKLFNFRPFDIYDYVSYNKLSVNDQIFFVCYTKCEYYKLTRDFMKEEFNLAKSFLLLKDFENKYLTVSLQ